MRLAARHFADTLPPGRPAKASESTQKAQEDQALGLFCWLQPADGETLFGLRGLLAAVDPFGFARRRVFRQARFRVGVPFRRRRVPETSDPLSASQPSPTRSGQVVRVGL